MRCPADWNLMGIGRRKNELQTLSHPTPWGRTSARKPRIRQNFPRISSPRDSDAYQRREIKHHARPRERQREREGEASPIEEYYFAR